MPENWMFLVRREPAHAKGKGADRGDVVVMRRADTKDNDVLVLKSKEVVYGKIKKSQSWYECKECGEVFERSYVDCPACKKGKLKSFYTFDIATAEGMKKFDSRVDLAEIHRKLTATERKVFLVVETTLNKSEVLQKMGQIRPQATFQPIGDIPSEPEEMEAWMAAMEAERKKLPKFGLKVNFGDVPGVPVGRLGDLGYSVEPVKVDKAVVKEKTAEEIAAEKM